MASRHPKHKECCQSLYIRSHRRTRLFQSAVSLLGTTLKSLIECMIESKGKLVKIVTVIEHYFLAIGESIHTPLHGGWR